MATDADLNRARTPLPRRHLTASDFESRSRMFNDVLTDIEGLQTRTCEDHTLDDMFAIRGMLLSAANADLNQIYESANDNRRLSRSAAGSVFVPQDESLAAVMRDAMCVEAVNVYTHHLTEGEKAEFHELCSLPLMPELEHTRDGARSLGDDVEYVEVFDTYDDALVCNICHSVVTDDDILVPDAPLYPDNYYVVISVETDGSGFEVTDEIEPARSSEIRQYSWPLRAQRSDIVYQDGSDYKVQIRVDSVMYEFYPVTQECEVKDMSFGILHPGFLQIGPEGTETIQEPDEVINEIECSVWNRREPNTLDPHTIYWSKAGNYPVRKLSTGGPGELKIADYVSFVPGLEPDPTIFALPDYCLDKMIRYPDLQCSIDTDPADWESLCPDLRPPSPVLPTFGNEALDLRNQASTGKAAESPGLETAGIAGIAVAGAVFAVAGVVAAFRFKGRQHLHGTRLLNPPLDEAHANDARSVQMGDSDRSLSQKTASV